MNKTSQKGLLSVYNKGPLQTLEKSKLKMSKKGIRNKAHSKKQKEERGAKVCGATCEPSSCVRTFWMSWARFWCS